MPKPHSEKNGSGHETNSPKLAQWVYCQVTSRSTASYQWECVSILPWSPVIFSYSHLATISLSVNSLDTQGDSAWQDVNKRNSWAYSGWSQALKDVVSPHKFQRFFSAAQQVLFAWIRFGVSLAPSPPPHTHTHTHRLGDEARANLSINWILPLAADHEAGQVQSIYLTTISSALSGPCCFH